ncbi:MAG: rod shape-determining protein MreD [Clostridia bacterium]|nr:rod shape-determining protein MreD [Clostridia bacterium]
MKHTSLNDGGLFRNVKQDWMRWTAFGVILLLSCFIQMAPFSLQIAGAKPLLLIAFTVCIALFVGPLGGGIAGAFAGFLWDIFSTRTLGFNAIILLVVGTACGLLIWMMMRNNILTAVLLTAGACLTQIILDWGFHYLLFDRGNEWDALLSIYLPNGLYTVLISPLVYWVVLITVKHLRSRE